MKMTYSMKFSDTELAFNNKIKYLGWVPNTDLDLMPETTHNVTLELTASGKVASIVERRTNHLYVWERDHLLTSSVASGVWIGNIDVNN